jgi:hypothetical protein
MPREIVLDYLPIGYSRQASRAGGEADVSFRDFVSSEDGQLLITRLEGTPRTILEKISDHAGHAASVTNNLLAVIRPDRTATVYWNEIYFNQIARAKRDIAKGGDVHIDNILEIERVVIPDGLIPPDAGVCYVFSSGWRKGYFYDYGPLLHDDERRYRTYDLGATLGQLVTRLIFQHVFRVSEKAWDQMFKQGWFPFSHLSKDLIEGFISFAEASLPIDDHLQGVVSEVATLITEQIPHWRKHSVISAHLLLIERAFERFKGADYISAASILYPRVEGIIRSYRSAIRKDSPSQAQLAETASGRDSNISDHSLLLPRKFEDYMRSVYFARFEPNALSETISRNTAAHGVVAAERLNQKAAVIPFLILLQLSSIMAAGTSRVKPAPH